MRRAALLALVLVAAGCGGDRGGHGSATLWVTSDRGAHVLYTGPVPAGLDAIQVVERRLKVTTRYGGRYVQSIGGLAGGGRHDWFYFVDGVEGDRSAAEVTVRPGSILWWDYRGWTPQTMEVIAVVGAWPEPFLHHGKTSVFAADRALAAQLAGQVHGVVDSKVPTRNHVVVGREAAAARRCTSGRSATAGRWSSAPRSRAGSPPTRGR